MSGLVAVEISLRRVLANLAVAMSEAMSEEMSEEMSEAMSMESCVFDVRDGGGDVVQHQQFVVLNPSSHVLTSQV